MWIKTAQINRDAVLPCGGTIGQLRQLTDLYILLTNPKMAIILPAGQWYAPSAVINNDGIAWYCMILHSIAWYCMVLHGIAWFCMVLHGIAWYCTVLHYLAPSCTILHYLELSFTILHYIALSCSDVVLYP